MLGLDEVAKTTVQSTLKEVTDTVARFEFAGRVEGTIYGVSTAIEVKGRYRFDLPTQSHRLAGHADQRGSAAPVSSPTGWTSVSRLQMIVTPAKEPASLADAALAKLTLKPTPERPAWRTNRRTAGWQMPVRSPLVSPLRPAEELGGRAAARRSGRAGRTVQLASLPQRDPDKLVSLDEFQEDVRRALGKSFGEFVEAEPIVQRGELPDLSRRGAGHVVRHSHAMDLLPRGRSAGPPGGLHVYRRAGAWSSGLPTPTSRWSSRCGSRKPKDKEEDTTETRRARRRQREEGTTDEADKRQILIGDALKQRHESLQLHPCLSVFSVVLSSLCAFAVSWCFLFVSPSKKTAAFFMVKSAAAL